MPEYSSNVLVDKKYRLARIISLSNLSYISAFAYVFLSIVIIFDTNSHWFSVERETRWVLSLTSLLSAIYYFGFHHLINKHLESKLSSNHKDISQISSSHLDVSMILLTLPSIAIINITLFLINGYPAIFYYIAIVALSSILIEDFRWLTFILLIVIGCLLLSLPVFGLIVPHLIVLLLWISYFIFNLSRNKSAVYDHLISENGKLVKDLEEASTLDQARLYYVSRMSHELRSPLHGMLAQIQLLRRDASLLEKEEDKLEMIEHNALHLRDVINEILDFSKIESGHMESNEETVDVVKILTDVRVLYEAEVTGKNISLTVEIDPELSRSSLVCTDHVKYKQIALNLLSNAVKYTEKGGIILGLKLLEKGMLIPGNHGQARYFEQRVLVLTISDTGPGMSSEDTLLVFEPFEQSSNRPHSIEGTGLGLPLAKQLANILDGDLELESALDIGSRFTFWIPYRDASDSMKRQESDSILVKTSSGEIENTKIEDAEFTERVNIDDHHLKCDSIFPLLRILIADDVEMNRNLMMDIFNDDKYDLKMAIDGEQAKSLALSWKPHLVFMDLNMPKLNGLESTKQIREVFTSEEMKIIGCSASAFENDNENFITAGADMVVTKPFTITHLIEIAEDTRNALGLKGIL
jgi:signal transduction histidine kinase/CheY-like chemotaxis protein